MQRLNAHHQTLEKGISVVIGIYNCSEHAMIPPLEIKQSQKGLVLQIVELNISSFHQTTDLMIPLYQLALDREISCIDPEHDQYH